MIRDDQALITHLGDARAYLLRGRRFQRLTRDHTLAQLLLDAGKHAEAEKYARQVMEIDVLDQGAQQILEKALTAQKKEKELAEFRELLKN